MAERVAAVIIGRNEGERLVRSLASLVAQDLNIVYVDSGSTDASVEEARKVGAEVVTLDLSVPFTAARARMAGFGLVSQAFPNTEFVQFVDGDCEIDHGWIAAGRAALETDDTLAVVFGHQNEKFPEATVYNKLIDEEWANAPVGPARSCGGNALMRVAALNEVGGYRTDLIAGEEPELCYRMREKGWKIRRIDAAMARHNADMTRFSQWWQRSRRAGHTYAEGVAIHGSGPERYRKPELRRSLLWGLAIPLAILLAALLITPWALLLVLIYPLQVLRLARRLPLKTAFFLTLGKFPETHGALGYWAGRLAGIKRRKLIEYK